MKAEELIKDKTFLAWYNQSDTGSVRLWEDRIKASSEIREIVEEAVILLQLSALKETEPSDEKLMMERNRLMRSIQEEETAMIPLQRKRWFGWVAAASVLVLLGAVWVFNYQRKQYPEYRTAANEMREILLPDSSVVSLNHDSHLKLLSAWSEKDSLREVWLDGEAFFTVRHTAGNTKFIVHTDDLKVEVLGTTFNVKKQAELTTVVLESGKVQLSSEEKPEELIVMQPGQLAEYRRASGAVTQKQVNPEIFTAWKEGKIIFENAAIGEVVMRLSETYGIDVDYSALDETGNQFNGTFPANDITVLLSALSKAYSWQIEQHGQKIVLKPGTPE